MSIGMITILAAVAAFALTSLLGLWLIPLLRRMHCTLPISDTVPSWHRKKEGTPTMGGIMLMIGTLTAAVIGWCTHRLSLGDEITVSLQLQKMESMKFFFGILMAGGFGVIGLMDDTLRAVKKRPGLTEKQKLLFQILIAVLYLIAVRLSGDHMTALYLPFLGRLRLGVLYYPVSVLLIVGTVRAIDRTDGLDGLCSSVAMVSSMGLMVICNLLGQYGIGVFASALAGGCLGFLVWNMHPAKVFMGRTGSYFIGGALTAAAFGAGIPGMLLPVGIVWWAELLSVSVQRLYLKATGKRLFKMTPIHHHFEMNGSSEGNITALFSAVTAVGCVLAILSVRFM